MQIILKQMKKEKILSSISSNSRKKEEEEFKNWYYKELNENYITEKNAIM